MKLTKQILHRLIAEPLNEAKWLSGRGDEDYSKGGMLFFDKNDTYEKEGKTTGLVHHALKHAGHVKPDLKPEYNELMKKMREIILKYAEKNPVYFRSGKQVIQISPEQLNQNKINKGQELSSKVWKNTFDAIQDKQANKIGLSNVEKLIFKQATPLVKKYDAITNQVLNDPAAKAEDPTLGKKAYIDKKNNLVITWPDADGDGVPDGIASLHGKSGDPEKTVQKAVVHQKVAEQTILTKQMLLEMIEEVIAEGRMRPVRPARPGEAIDLPRVDLFYIINAIESPKGDDHIVAKQSRNLRKAAINHASDGKEFPEEALRNLLSPGLYRFVKSTYDKHRI